MYGDNLVLPVLHVICVLSILTSLQLGCTERLKLTLLKTECSFSPFIPLTDLMIQVLYLFILMFLITTMLHSLLRD